MARPIRHVSSGIFWFRRRVPADLKPVLGKREEKVSLRTRDPSEAKIAHARVSAEVEARWAGLRQGMRRLSHKEAIAIAGDFYRKLVAQHENDPGDPALVLGRLLLDQVAAGSKEVQIIKAGRPDYADRMLDKLKSQNRPAVEKLLLDQGLHVDPESLDRVLQAVNAAIVQGREHLLRNAKGDYRPDPEAERFPEWHPPTQQAFGSTRKPADFELVQVFERFSAEAGHAASTVKRWKPIIKAVSAEVPDIRDLTDLWCVAWKDRLIASGLSHASVQNGYLAALRSTCEWAVSNKLIAANPVKGVGVKVPKPKRLRPKGFTDEEAAIVLNATLQPLTQKLSPEHAAARRWLPWLCAYSGARVGEMAQLRAEDVQCHKGVWLMWITPEAGSTKDGNARFVAIHPHLIEQGFVQFVQQKKGAIFYSEARQRNGSAANPTYKKAGERVAAWVRSLGLTDRQLQPNHGWRHRFKTLARKFGMDPGTRDYMQGQVPHNEAEQYGDYEPEVLLREISKLPRFCVLAAN